MERRDDYDPDRYRFRGLHPGVLLGTASDRYAGWIGQIYTTGRYTGQITRRPRQIGGRTFKESVLPVESVAEYFEHFRVLEIDYTFYGLLLDRQGAFTRTYHTLASYRDQLAEGDSLILKAPQAIFAQKIRRGAGYAPNPDYLNPELFTHCFYEPARDLLGEHLRAFVFEQEYQRSGERIPAADLVRSLDAFFGAIPADDRYHVELRTESYLTGAAFRILEEHGVGQILSHWTWLPTLGAQFARSGRRFFSSGRQAVMRLMTPLGTRYEDAYAMAYPFDALVEGMLQPQMIEDAAQLAREAVAQGVAMHIIVNNRSGGNAPEIARRVACRFAAAESGEPAS
ncbi:MAG: DUF72 domain-containing protein [Syntrophobacteraceae bacterium]|nr:DUF72 domain-containing protein [Desulfobacteraceae bacterium]